MLTCTHCESTRVINANFPDSYRCLVCDRACAFTHRPTNADGSVKETA